MSDLREHRFKLDSNPAPLVVVDFMVLSWGVFNWIEGIRHLYSPDLVEKLIKAAWAVKINRGPDMLPRHDHRIVVVSDKRYEDSKTYWRGVEVLKDERIEACWEEYAEGRGISVQDIPTGYKGNRREKNDEFYQTVQIGWEYVTKYFPCFKEEGQEADDWAGLLYREVRDTDNDVLKKRQKLLSSVDRDWTGLVDEELNIYWANTRYPGPRERIQERLAGEDQVLLHTEMKLGFDIKHPLEIFAAKAEAGELGDNLPPGAPIEYIDLSQPHPKYDLRKSDLYSSFVEEISKPESNTHHEHYEQAIAGLKGTHIPFPDCWEG